MKVIAQLQRSYYIESINQEWKKSAPPFLSISHYELYGTCYVTTHDEPSNLLITQVLVPLLFEESITRSPSKSVQPFF